MRSKRLLTELLDYLELFEEAFPSEQELSLQSFIAFASSLLHDRPTLQNTSTPLSHEVSIARQLSLLQRYSRSYIKRALAVSQLLQSEEEYSYLVSLMGGPLSKTALNTLNAIEKTTGAEVIRRLAAKGLVQESPDERDRRSVLVSITPLGRAELAKVLPQLRLAATLVSQPLEQEQRTVLDLLLGHLCQTHAQLATSKGDSSLSDLMAQLSNKRES